ncbi:MAG: hypothetical protein KGS45_01335 [Planctomycetes bacterium]|nr:hypothetical protein [Planctomycetota bacterium]
MTPDASQPDPTEDLDLLISRVVDHDTTPAHWSAFESAAGTNTVAWRELALAQRDALSLSQAAHAAASRASAITLPSEADAMRPIRLEEARRELDRAETPDRRFFSHSRGYLGWAAAAALAIAFYSGRLNPTSTNVSNPAQSASIIPQFNNSTTRPTEDYLARYLDQGHEEGRVVGELPDKVLIRATPTALTDGTIGYDVYYVRQILERVQVPDLYTFGATQDELGRATMQPVPVRINAPARGPM